MTDEPQSPDGEPNSPGQERETGAEKRERKSWQQVAKYGELGFLLPACTFVGWALGAGLDRWQGTKWGTLTGVLLGVVTGFVQMIRVALRASR
ncbi:MAG: AtpZ/AtpI family protein [Candidatus Koribacter versatilis]|uniref:AtpZ/AtpI family protein n=1 Tax=Candidatus Korobacter versatilis TaxID=658062 RepID=A0A932A6S2_9BACT|nr:AtpZ/AtpI family protein [Candidatus Koribacter versatilis]